MTLETPVASVKFNTAAVSSPENERAMLGVYLIVFAFRLAYLALRSI